MTAIGVAYCAHVDGPQHTGQVHLAAIGYGLGLLLHGPPIQKNDVPEIPGAVMLISYQLHERPT